MFIYFRLVLILSAIQTCLSTRSLDDFELTETLPKQLWNETTTDKLRRDLFVNYDKYSRPEKHYNVTKVKIGMNLIYLETNELKSTLTVTIWLRLMWTDNKLKWSPESYGGLSVLRIAEHEIWQPDIYFYNGVSGGEPIVRADSPNVLVYPDGSVLWVPALVIRALCQFDLRYWPFDTQQCSFRFGPWTHSGYEISLELYDKGLDLDDYSTQTWMVTKSSSQNLSKTYSCCTEPYHEVQFNVTMARKNPAYKEAIITPAIVIASIILVQFWLPPQAKERLILNCLNLSVIIVFLLYFTSQLAAAGSNTPLIVIFYSTSLFLTCFAMVVKELVFRLLSIITDSHTISRIIKKYLGGSVKKILFLDFWIEKDNLHLDNQKQNFYLASRDKNLNAPRKYNSEEMMLALTIDRILFLLYTFIYLIWGIIYLI